MGGDHVKVTTLVGPDGDPHTFEPSPKDSAALSKADVVVVNGLGLEGWLDRPVKASGFKGQLVIASTGVKTHTLEEDGKTVTDPHAWNSAANGALYAQNILNGLVKADPQDKAALEASGKPYITQLNQLDSWAKMRFSQIPQAKRKVLTSHDAFGYFSRAYGVTFMAPQGLSSESDASAAQVAEIINQIKADGVKPVYGKPARSASGEADCLGDGRAAGENFTRRPCRQKAVWQTPTSRRSATM